MTHAIHLFVAVTGVICFFSSPITSNKQRVKLGASLPLIQSKMSSNLEMGSFNFAIQLYRTLSKPNANLVISPFSLSTALAMTLYGSRGSTGTQLSKTLFGVEMNENDYESMVQEYHKLVETAITSNSQVLSVANNLYSQIKYPILPRFQQILEKYFSASAKQLDFEGNKDVALGLINKDVSDATKQKIPQLLKDIDPLTKLILVNAVYFKGLWTSQFKKEETKKSEFRLSEGGQVEVDMMHQNGKFHFGFSEELNCKALKLGYDKSNAALIILLPEEGSSLSDMEGKLTQNTLDKILKEMYEMKVDVTLPRFKLESTLNLIPQLKQLGISHMFDVEKADFSGITNDPLGLYVSDVVQKAVIEVNEEGTEAAAGSAVSFMSRSLAFPEEFHANKPFMFLLVSREGRDRNLILFMGAVRNPTK